MSTTNKQDSAKNYWQDFWNKFANEVHQNPFEQVGRTLDKRAMAMPMFLRQVERYVSLLELTPKHQVLDLCCGNGLLALQLAPRVRQVVAVDFCAQLIEELGNNAHDNVTVILGDALQQDFPDESMDRIVIAAAIQHFTESQVIKLLDSAVSWLAPGGRLLLTDVLDRERLWSFYNSREREAAYFNGLGSDAPVLGTWVERDWLAKLAKYVGFTDSVCIEQPQDYWYSHYRFDFLLIK